MDNKTIEITPELNRRVQGERRKDARERMADLERRLQAIAAEIRQTEFPEDLDRQLILDLAEGRG